MLRNFLTAKSGYCVCRSTPKKQYLTSNGSWATQASKAKAYFTREEAEAAKLDDTCYVAKYYFDETQFEEE